MINASFGSTLSGSTAPLPGSADLSSEGILDWAHWGLTNASSFNHKSGVTQQISNYTLTGANNPGRFSGARVAYSWSGGTPTLSTPGSTMGIYFYGIGNGYQLTLPADTTERTLKLYIGLWSARGRFEARLSDNSVPVFVEIFDNPAGILDTVVTLNYSAASSGASLIVDYIVEDNYGQPLGNITLQAATLIGTISDVRFNTNQSNQAPVLGQIGDIVVNEGVAISLNPTATDADGDTLTFSYSGWRTSRSYTTNYTDAGTHTVTVTVSDGILTDSQDVKITVLNTNQAPVLGQISDITVNVGDTVVFNPAAIDLDEDALAFSYTGWMESNSKTTNSSDSGTRTVTVTVSDGSLTDTKDVAVTVIGGTATSTPNITWTDIVGVTIEGNTITKNATTEWGNGGAASQEKFTGDGGISVTVAQADRYSDNFMVGLSSSNLDADYASIEYAVVFQTNKIHIIESGAYKGSFGLYLDGDSFSVERTGSTIDYKKNGTVFYTSATTTNAALLADVAIYNSGGTISNVRFNTNPVPMLSQISDTTLANVSQVIVSWDANAEADLDGYNVWYRDLSKDDNLIKKYVKKPTTEITLNLTSGVTYYFEVIAEDFSGNKSSPSVLTYYVPLP